MVNPFTLASVKGQSIGSPDVSLVLYKAQSLALTKKATSEPANITLG